MKISYEWLKELVELREAPEEVAERLTMAGLEVEAVTRVEPAFSGVVAAVVRAVERHPNADKLTVCRVWDGSDELQVVCGAPNVRAGATVPLARVGGRVAGRAIEKAKLRGVESFGMICSERELGFSDEVAGIWLIADEVAAGKDIAAAFGIADAILEVSLTPNRPDGLSHCGIARELGAILDRDCAFPRPSPVDAGPPATSLASVEILDAGRCPRYAARVLTGVKVAPSPTAMRLRLARLGVRPISNIVDITNFVLLERGHPLHAFDLARLAGARIVVRTARTGEPVVAIDGVERKLEPTDLVIADAERPQAIAGVMGARDSEVTGATASVLLESAYFDPVSVRKTARRLGLHTEASHRFERGADPEGIVAAIDRVAELSARLAGATVATGTIDVYPRPVAKRTILLRPARVTNVLGAAPGADFVRRRFARLGLVDRGNDNWEAPSFRPDLTREIDLIEEIARLWGYDNVPETLPKSLPYAGAVADEAAADAVRARLVALGFLEATNVAFTSADALDPFDGARPRVRIQNPLGKDASELRTTLFPSLLRNVALNQANGEHDLRLFEINRVFTPLAGSVLPRERLRAALVMTGRRAKDAWEANATAVDFADVKGIAESLITAMGAHGGIWRRSSLASLHPGASFEYAASADGDWFLRGGELHPEIAARIGQRSRVFLLEVALDRAASRRRPLFEDLPRFPAASRDIALVVADGVEASAVEDLVRAEGGALVEAVALFDLYRGAPIPAGKKSLAYSIRYRSRERTLTDDEITALHERIVKKLQSAAGADIRA